MRGKQRGENEEKAEISPAREERSVWKKRKSPEKTTVRNKSRGKNEEKAKIPPAQEERSVWKK